MRTAVSLLALVVCSCNSSVESKSGSRPQTQLSDLTGEMAHKLPPDERQSAVVAIVHRLLAAPANGESQDEHIRIESCVKIRTEGQVGAMVDKYLRDHPERWHEPLAELVSDTLMYACGSRSRWSGSTGGKAKQPAP